MTFSMPTDDQTKPLIAIVDDDPAVRKALSRLLRASGYDVGEHASGVELLSSLQQRTPQCIVLDLHMPDLNGLEVQVELARAGWCIPVILITADGEADALARAVERGAVACLDKPIDSATLLRTISRALTNGGAAPR